MAFAKNAVVRSSGKITKRTTSIRMPREGKQGSKTGKCYVVRAMHQREPKPLSAHRLAECMIEHDTGV